MSVLHKLSLRMAILPNIFEDSTMARPSVKAFGNAFIATTNVVTDLAGVITTSSQSLVNLANVGATVSKAYADNVAFETKARSYDDKEAILDEVAMSIAKRKTENELKVAENETLAVAYDQQSKALREFMTK